MASRTRVLLVALAAAACARSGPASDIDPGTTPLLPGSHVLAPGASLTDTIEYHMLRDARSGEAGGKDLGAGRLEWQRATYDGRPVLLLVRSFAGAGGSFTDSSMVAADGFAPLWESQRMGTRHTLYTYEGAHVMRTVLAPDSAASRREHQYDGPVFHFNEVELLARAIPLRAGYSAVMPLYSEGDDAVEHDTLTVLGRDGVGAWSVRFADPAIVGLYGIDGATRHITRYDITSRKQGVRAHLVISPRG